MRALAAQGSNGIRLVDVDDPTPGPGEVRIRVTDCLLTRGDAARRLPRVETELADQLSEPDDGSRSTDADRTPPSLVLGHRFGGVIDAVGSGVRAGRIGERVGVLPWRGCGECPECRGARPNRCRTPFAYGLRGFHGGMARYAVVRAKCAVQVPDAAFGYALEPLLSAYALIQKCRATWLDMGGRALVLGAGPVGVCAAGLLRDAYGVTAEIDDLLPGRCHRARTAGLTLSAEAEANSRSTSSRPVRLVLDCAGADLMTGRPALHDAIPRVASGGAIFALGDPSWDLELPVSADCFRELRARELTLGWSAGYSAPDVDTLLPLLASIQPCLDAVVERVDLEFAATDGLRCLRNDPDQVTAFVVTPDRDRTA